MHVFDLDEAVNRCFGKYHIFQEMAGHFSSEADDLVRQMRAGVDQDDADAIGRAAHRLKNTVVFLGAAAAAEATHRVEQIGRAGLLAEASEAIDELKRQVKLLEQALRPHCSSDQLHE